LKSLTIKPTYNSKDDDITNSFYNPVLAKTKIYKRVSAYFDSNIINAYSKGLENIVKLNGRVKFIFSCDINEKDFEIIKKGYEDRKKLEEYLENKVHISEPTTELINLGFLIKHNYVDIKIAFVETNGIYHDKFGICQNGDDLIYFRGSNNETVASLNNNFERFETTCSWNADHNEKVKINEALNMFDNLWNCNVNGVIVIDMPDVIKNKLISYAGETIKVPLEKLNNSVILDYVENTIIIQNNLKNPDLLAENRYFYKASLLYYVESKDSSKLYLKKIGYRNAKSILKEFEDYATLYEFSVYTTNAFCEFLNKNDVLIEKRRNLGIGIKKKLDTIQDDFLNFAAVVNKEMKRELREPQMYGAFHIVRMMRSANFSVPGSGKTSIVYGAFSYLICDGKVNRIVMIGPINSFSSWKKEFKACFGGKLEMKCYDFQDKKKHNKQMNYLDALHNNYNLYLFNYESLTSNVKLLKQLIDEKTLLVFDEVHRIKSIDGKRAVLALNICNNAKYRVVLTGTPIPNGYADIYNMFNILYTDDYSFYFNFNENTLRSANTNVRLTQEVNDKIFPFFCRTNKTDLNVPKANPDHKVFVEVSEKEEKLFNLLYKHYSGNIFLLYIRLIQASNNPGLILNKITDKEIDETEFLPSSEIFTSQEIIFNEEETSFIKSFNMTSKFYKGIDLVHDLVKNGKLIVWAIFISTIEKIREELTKKDISCEIITGDTSLLKREEILEKFSEGDIEVLITNPHTLGESISLHRICHQAVYFEYSFNLVHFLQSKDRIHRLGLNENQETDYYFLILEGRQSIRNPIDKMIYNRLLEKQKLQEHAVSNEDIVFVFEDVLKDIKDLLGDI